jgi:hypothetical protein
MIPEIKNKREMFFFKGLLEIIFYFYSGVNFRFLKLFVKKLI